MFANVEAWALAYINSTDLWWKLAPPAPPAEFAANAAPLVVLQPGRPAELRQAKKGDRLPKAPALREPLHRAKVLHAFLHHELQAAELMCWAILAFCDAELEFRQGLLRVCLDEIRHMNAYREHMRTLGHDVGDFGVRDWFWSRVPKCPNKLSFVAVMGMGLEAANLDYVPYYAHHFRLHGDVRGAEVQELIGEDEIAHVRFATKWYTQWTGRCDFDEWVAQLPPPWSPWVLRGEPMAEVTRVTAGMPLAFVAALKSYVPDAKGRS